MSVKIKIELEDFVEVTRERNPESEWDGDDISHTYSISGYSIVNNGYWDFILENDPKDKILYFVYAIYNTGDSFHCDANRMCEIGLYENELDAGMVKKVLERDYKNHSNSFNPVTVYLPSGKKETLCTSTWKGWFQELNIIVVEPILPADKNKVNY